MSDAEITSRLGHLHGKPDNSSSQTVLVVSDKRDNILPDALCFCVDGEITVIGLISRCEMITANVGYPCINSMRGASTPHPTKS